jgi:hypothetical protein
MEHMAGLRDADQAIELTPGWQAVRERYDQAIGVALAKQRIPVHDL